MYVYIDTVHPLICAITMITWALSERALAKTNITKISGGDLFVNMSRNNQLCLRIVKILFFVRESLTKTITNLIFPQTVLALRGSGGIKGW